MVWSTRRTRPPRQQETGHPRPGENVTCKGGEVRTQRGVFQEQTTGRIEHSKGREAHDGAAAADGPDHGHLR